MAVAGGVVGGCGKLGRNVSLWAVWAGLGGLFYWYIVRFWAGWFVKERWKVDRLLTWAVWAGIARYKPVGRRVGRLLHTLDINIDVKRSVRV